MSDNSERRPGRSPIRLKSGETLADALANRNSQPNSMSMPLSDINDLDAVVHALGIEDSDTTPAEAVAELKAEVERLRAGLCNALSGSDDDRAIADALRRDNAFLGYVIHGPLLPEQEARATKVERDALRADNERLRLALNEIGYDINPAFARERARAALVAKETPDG